MDNLGQDIPIGILPLIIKPDPPKPKPKNIDLKIVEDNVDVEDEIKIDVETGMDDIVEEFIPPPPDIIKEKEVV